MEETIFVSNSFVRGARISSRHSSDVPVPKLIKMNIQTAFDLGVLEKINNYGRGRDFIQKKIEEIIAHSQLTITGLLKNTVIQLTLSTDVILINEKFKMNHQDLHRSRKYQANEETPIIIFIDNFGNNMKGLSYR